MIDLNVLNYFLVVLGGFGVMWGYRYFSKEQDKKIGEFEYAAFSALWGIPIVIVFILLTKENSLVAEIMSGMPMLVSPFLFGAGVFIGWILNLVKLFCLPALKRIISSPKEK